MGILQALSVVAIASSILACPKASVGTKKEEASSSAFSSVSLSAGTHVRIESEGAPFYISFGKVRTNAEMARLSYIFDEVSFSYSDLDKAGIFVSDLDSVSSTYSGKEVRSFQKEFQDSYANSGSAETMEAYVQDRASYLFNTGALYSLLFFKASETDSTNAILRNNVVDYTQASLGLYEDAEGMDGRFGYYFDGAKVTLSFLTMFTYGCDFTLYYQEGVNVVLDNETIAPTIIAEDYEVLEGTVDNAGEVAFYNKSLCYIPLIKTPAPEDTIVEYDHIEVNGVIAEELSLKKDGGHYFLVGKFNDGDEISIVTRKKISKEDKNVTVYDLYDVSGYTSLSFTKLYDGSTGIGNIPNEANNAFRFVLNTPSVDGSAWVGERQTKFGIWTSNSGMWSNFGYIIRFRQNSLTILNGEEVTLANVESSVITSRSSLLVVVGLAKVYDESGHWFANRIYVDVNGSRIASYDDTERRSIGSVITAPYIGQEGGEVSFEDSRKANLIPVNDATSNEHVHAVMDSYVVSGGDVNASFALDDGYKFLSFQINGVESLDDLIYENGIYSLKIEGVSSEVKITYTLISDVHIRLSLSGDVIDSDYDNAPLYGSKPVVSFSVEQGKIPSSVKVNGVESVSELTRNGKVYSLALGVSVDDVSVVVETKEASYAVGVSSSNDSHANISISSDSVPAGGSTSFTLSLEKGYLLENISINGEAVLSCNGGVYFLDEVFGDVSIEAKTRKEETQASPESKSGLSWLPITLYCIAGASVLAFGVSALILVKKKKENN